MIDKNRFEPSQGKLNYVVHIPDNAAASTGADMARVLLCFWVVAPSGARWDGGIFPEQAFAAGWRYLAPVTPPDEVAALRAELAAVREALDTFVETMDMWAGDNSDRAHDGIWRAIKTARAALGDPE